MTANIGDAAELLVETDQFSIPGYDDRQRTATHRDIRGPGGTIKMICRGKMKWTHEQMVVYSDTAQGHIWVVTAAQFDFRYQPIHPAINPGPRGSLPRA